MAALLGTTSAHAAGNQEGLYFLGAMGNTTYVGSAKDDNDAALLAGGATGLQSSMGTSSTGLKLIVGYQYNASWAVEGGLVDAGKFGYSATKTGGWVTADYKMSGINFSGVGLLPLNKLITVFGKLGYTAFTLNTSINGAGGSVSPTQTANSGGYGAGVIFRMNEKMGLRLEWEKMSSDVNMVSLGLQTRF